MRIETWTRLALALLAIGAGCSRANPAYRGMPEGGATDSGTGDAGADTAPDGRNDGGTDLRADITADSRSDAADGGRPCVTAADCSARGAPVCGAWECRNNACVVNCPNCTDGDGDGFGVGAGCAGPDCDDADPNIQASGERTCPGGPVTQGSCRAGTQSCTNGVWTTCTGQVGPTAEACNGEDDDCNGAVDDGLPQLSCGLGACQNSVASCGAGALAVCVPLVSAVDTDACDGIDNDCDGQVDEDCPAVIAACIHVSPNGRDNGNPNGSINQPFLTIPAAIAYANVSAPSPKTVCVAGGQTCSDRTTYTLPSAAFNMANGVSVYGSYESSNWTRCPLDANAPDPTTTLALGEATGVRFVAPAITVPTTLDGFVLTRIDAANATVSAVTVAGAKQVTLSNLVINDTPQAAHSYGVNLINGAEALITHCLIGGGAGTVDTFGVRSVGSKPTIRENCSGFTDAGTGRCPTNCSTTPPPGLGIAGRISAAAAGISAAVLLDTSPGARVETSTICGEQGTQAVGVYITGDATGTVIRGDAISGGGATTASIGVLAQDCAGAAPWIVGNELIEGQGGLRAAGVLAMGPCHPVIDGNTLIAGGGDGTTSEADGVSCETNTSGEPSRCAVLGNVIQGSSTLRTAALAAGVACKGQGCARVADNSVTGRSGGDVIGVWLRNDGTLVERNVIIGGCGAQSAVGILADDAFARLENNLVSGGSCQLSVTPSSLNVGLVVYNANDANELDVHSNTIDGGGNLGACNSFAVAYGVGPETPPTAPKGIFRNNILRGGACNTRTDFAEISTAADPRLFENNDLDPTGLVTSPTILYLDENATAIRVVTSVNALTDIGARANISQLPMFVSPTDLHLGDLSACKGAGTPAGEPLTDFDGKTRSTTAPTIGAYE